jgi:DNA-binding transcriptional LysR family regulator
MAYFREQDMRGSVHLGVSETIVHVWLSDFLKEFSVLYPKVEINTYVDTSLHLREMLVSREIDCAFMLGPVSEPSMTNDGLCSIALSFACHPDIGKDFRNPTRLADLTFITYSKHTKPSVKLFSDLKALNIPKPRFIASSSLATNLELARKGVGIALLPKVLIEQEKAAGRLVEPVIPAMLKPSSLDFTATFPTTTSNILIKQVSRIAHAVSNKKLLSK